MINKFSEKHRYLSNFWLSPVILDSTIYPSVENAYQAAKLQENNKRRSTFINCSPGKAKREGKEISETGVGVQNWNEIKLSVMTKLLQQKFVDGSFLAEKLVKTNGCEIVEGNTWGDTYWGVCAGVGENNLGKLLMSIRDELDS